MNAAAQHGDMEKNGTLLSPCDYNFAELQLPMTSLQGQRVIFLQEVHSYQFFFGIAPKKNQKKARQTRWLRPFCQPTRL
jgi:hypothetical protein